MNEAHCLDEIFLKHRNHFHNKLETTAVADFKWAEVSNLGSY